MRIKVVTNSHGIQGKIDELIRQLGELTPRFMEKLARDVVSRSPVDTGTYITSHTIQYGRNEIPLTESSDGKPKRQPREPKEALAIANLQSDIERLPNDITNVYIGSRAMHGDDVERRHAVYAQARRELRNNLKEAFNELR